MTANTVGRKGHHLAKHFGGFVEAGLMVIKNAEPIVRSPVVRTESNGLLISAFGLRKGAELLVRIGKPLIGCVIGGFTLQDSGKLLYRIGVVSGSEGKIAQKGMGGGQLSVHAIGGKDGVTRL